MKTVASQIIEKYAKGQEDNLIETYISKGPKFLRESLGLLEGDFQVIFDYLVFEHNLLFKTALANTDFFLDEYIKFGMNHVRDILGVDEAKYDLIWEAAFDLLAISHEGLYYHVFQYREKYLLAFKARGADFVRTILRIKKPKYNGTWEMILDVFLNAECDAIFSKQTFENGIKHFSVMINRSREQRLIGPPKSV